LIDHSISCKRSGIDIIYDLSSSIQSSFNLGYKATVDGVTKEIVTLKFDGNWIYTVDQSGTKQKIGQADSNEHVYNISIDTTSMTYTVSQDSVILYSGDILINSKSTLSTVNASVVVTYNYGYLRLYKVQTYGWGNTLSTQAVSEIKSALCDGYLCQMLDNCVNDQPDYFQASRSNGTISKYPNVEVYCAGRDDDCTMDTLRMISVYRSSCTKEVFGYCVDYAFPAETGSEAGGTSGVTTCTAILGANTIVDRMVKPMWKSAYSVIVGNFMAVAVIFLLLIIVFSVRGKR
jgi:hypothetical protein